MHIIREFKKYLLDLDHIELTHDKQQRSIKNIIKIVNPIKSCEVVTNLKS